MLNPKLLNRLLIARIAQELSSQRSGSSVTNSNSESIHNVDIGQAGPTDAMIRLAENAAPSTLQDSASSSSFSSVFSTPSLSSENIYEGYWRRAKAAGTNMAPDLIARPYEVPTSRLKEFGEGAIAKWGGSDQQIDFAELKAVYILGGFDDKRASELAQGNVDEMDGAWGDKSGKISAEEFSNAFKKYAARGLFIKLTPEQ